ncbi:Hypothetical Protein RSKD131_3802 [Cereibacter sphaeroides KD131]|nr:Hypothetical Protein RSKD131_3802 [Cereibacter sphaeroides KD131]
MAVVPSVCAGGVPTSPVCCAASVASGAVSLDARPDPGCTRRAISPHFRSI